MFALEDMFGKKIDLVTERSLSNPYFIASAGRTKQLIYAA
jgi:predicted nucleotidyltransferase